MFVESILFDLDGTLLDSNELTLRSFEEVLERFYPGHYTREDILPHMGKTLREQMEIFGPERVEELVKVYQEINVRLHDDYVAAFPHVVDVVAELNRLGVSLAVVTNKRRLTTEMGLKLCGLAPHMEAVVCFEDTQEHKPWPAPLLLAMARIGADPEATLMVGDSPYDILAAKRAGVRSAAVAWSVRGEDELRSYHPDVWVRDMRELLMLSGSASGRR